MILRPYAVATTIQGLPLIALGTMDYKVNPTLANGDVKVTKDGVGAVNPDTLPDAFPASSSQVRIQLTATEMTAKIVVVTFVDQTSPKQWEDQRVVIETYRHASAQHADFGPVTLAAGSITAATIATGAIDADAIADGAIDAGAVAAGVVVDLNLAQANATNNQPGQVGGQMRRTHALAGGTVARKDWDPDIPNPTWEHTDEAGANVLVTRTRTVAGTVETETPS